MTTPIIDNFADLGAALERLEKAKSRATADVPEPDAVAAIEQQLRVNQDWTSIYGIATAPSDYLGFAAIAPGERFRVHPAGYPLHGSMVKTKLVLPSR